MSIEQIKELYETINTSNQTLQGALGFSYIEALHETLQNLANNTIQQIDGEPSDHVVKELEALYHSLDKKALTPEVYRKAIQLSFLEGDRKDQLPSNYQMTPEAIAILMGYFAVKLLEFNSSDKNHPVHLFDPAIGSGNLWAVVHNELIKNQYQVEGEGYDNDDLLLAIADQSFKLQELAPRLYLGDGLQDLLAQPADVIVSDLPVGYYPLNEVAKTYQSRTNKGDSESFAYTHYLFIEQSLKYLKPNAWGIFLVPANLIEDEKMTHLLEGIQEYGYFQSLLTLPKNLFRQEKAQKAILIVQKQGDKAKQAQNVLVGNIPDLKDGDRMAQFMKSFNRWLVELS